MPHKLPEHPDTLIVMLFEEKDTLKEITFLKMIRYTASMIFDAYGPTNSVAILHPGEPKLFPGGHVWSARRLDTRKIYSHPLTYNVGHF